MSPTREVPECSREGLRRCLLTTSCLSDAVSPAGLGYQMFALAPLAQQVPAYLRYCLDFMHTQYILAAHARVPAMAAVYSSPLPRLPLSATWPRSVTRRWPWRERFSVRFVRPCSFSWFHRCPGTALAIQPRSRTVQRSLTIALLFASTLGHRGRVVWLSQSVCWNPILL